MTGNFVCKSYPTNNTSTFSSSKREIGGRGGMGK
uniref:Uncharacterized protein n=1 Tax=Rhizophora mucronata TaxID=61149 RepID=A0A2P2MYJ4_RHIMU